MFHCSSINAVTTVRPGLITVPYSDLGNFMEQGKLSSNPSIVLS
jgi:hypothetical protein